MKGVGNRIKTEIVKKTDEKKNLYLQSRSDFKGIHKSHQYYDSYTFKKNIIKMEKPLYLGFVILEVSKLIMYETYYDKLQKCFTQDSNQIHCQDTNSFVLSVETKDIVGDLIKLQDHSNLFDFSHLGKEQRLFSNEFKKIPGFLKIETPKSLYINKFVCLRSKYYAFKPKLDGDSKTFKGICKGFGKEISFEQYHNCLKSLTDKKECKQFRIRSHYLKNSSQKKTKKPLSPSDDKKEYTNKTESRPWGYL